MNRKTWYNIVALSPKGQYEGLVRVWSRREASRIAGSMRSTLNVPVYITRVTLIGGTIRLYGSTRTIGGENK